MRKLLLIASLAVLAAPCVAMAQDSDMSPDNDKTSGTYDIPNADGPSAYGPSADDPNANVSNAGDFGKDVAYSGAPDDVMSREAWFDHQIRKQNVSGAISDDDAMQDRQLLASVRRQQDEFQNDHGALTSDDRAGLNDQLDGLKARIDQQLGEVH
jgi:hypothetical protein